MSTPRRRRLTRALLLGLLAVAAPAAAGQRELTPAPTATLHIDLPLADVVLTGVDGRAVRVAAQTPDDAASLDALALRSDANGDVRISLADPAAVMRRPLRWRIEAPRALAVRARIVRGSLDAEGLRGRAILNVETGHLTARDVRLAEGHSLKCRTFNGDVRVLLASTPADARILALTLNGAIASAIPLATRAAFGPRFGETTLGSGAHVLSIDVVRGDIRIETSPRPGVD